MRFLEKLNGDREKVAAGEQVQFLGLLRMGVLNVVPVRPKVRAALIVHGLPSHRVCVASVQ